MLCYQSRFISRFCQYPVYFWVIIPTKTFIEVNITFPKEVWNIPWKEWLSRVRIDNQSFTFPFRKFTTCQQQETNKTSENRNKIQLLCAGTSTPLSVALSYFETSLPSTTLAIHSNKWAISMLLNIPSVIKYSLKKQIISLKQPISCKQTYVASNPRLSLTG